MTFNRRMFLRGAAGFTLALPFLPSLLKPGAARAGGSPARKRFFALGVDHGAVRQSNMVPDASKLSPIDYAGQKIRSGSLVDLMKSSGGKTVLSPVLDAGGAELDQSLVIRYDAPASFTGEDAVEILTHGGLVVPTTVLGALIAHGARLAQPHQCHTYQQ